LANRYELLGEVGHGTTGTVYRARDARTRKIVAVKLLHESRTSDPEDAQRFRQEAAIMKSLTSPRIARVLDFSSDNGTPFIVMEFVEGITLKQLIDEGGPLDCGFALSIMVQVAQALQVAHAKDVIHRDIKPSNIKVLPDGSVKVLDFSIAKLGDMTTVTVGGAVRGSVLYMAPEQALGQADARSDIYSLGVVAYQMLAGRVPFKAENPLAVMKMHAETMPRRLSELNPEVSQALADLVAACLRKAPNERFQNAGELLDSARKSQSADGPAVMPRNYIAVAERRRKVRKLTAGFRRRRRPMALAIATVTLGAGLGFVAFVMANCLAAGEPSPSVSGESPPKLSNMVLPKSDVDSEYLSLERADWESGVVSNDDFVLSEFCGQDEGREYLVQSERLTGYTARYVQPPSNIVYGVGPASILSTVELYEDPGRAQSALDMKADLLRQRLRQSNPDCWQNKIRSVSEFDEYPFDEVPVGEKAMRAIVRVVNEASDVQSLWTVVAFSRGRVLGTVAIQDVTIQETGEVDQRRQGDAIRLAQRQDQRIQVAFEGPDTSVASENGTSGAISTSETPQSQSSRVAGPSATARRQSTSAAPGAITAAPGGPPLATGTPLPPTATPTPFFQVTLDGEPGEYITNGEHVPFTGADTLLATEFDGHRLRLELQSTFNVGDWTLVLEAPEAPPERRQLVEGPYTGAIRWPDNGGNQPGLDVRGDGRGCGTATGWFNVLTAEYDPTTFFIDDIQIGFGQYCDGDAAALTGNLRLTNVIPGGGG